MWGGHSCPPPLVLVLVVKKSNSNPTSADRVSAPHKLLEHMLAQETLAIFFVAESFCSSRTRH